MVCHYSYQTVPPLQRKVISVGQLEQQTLPPGGQDIMQFRAKRICWIIQTSKNQGNLTSQKRKLGKGQDVCLIEVSVRGSKKQL